jgi:hypothetical protein
MAIAESGCPDSVVAIGDPDNPTEGKTYYDVVDNVVDYFAWGQNESNGRGGWRYLPNVGPSDQSVSGYVTLGLAYAEAPPPHGFGLTLPAFVKTELQRWIDYIQCGTHTAPDDRFGGSGYNSPCDSYTKNMLTGNLLFEMALNDQTNGQAWEDAVAYIVDQWAGIPWVRGYQGMYCVMKGFEFQGITGELPNSNIDWYADLADYIVANQNTTPGPFFGSWPANLDYGDEVLTTAWALLTLEKAAPPAEGGTVIIPNKVYERFGFGHWDYDGEIILDDACPPWYGVNPGDFFEIPIILEDFGASYPVGGFELEVEFDYIDLTFYGAMRGGLLEGRYFFPTELDTFFSWEYFAYRVLPCPLCACCKYKILLYGQAEMPDGAMRKGYCISPKNEMPYTYWVVDYTTEQEEIGATLVWLKFQVANNELLRDLKLPIFFEWEHKLAPDEMVIIEDWDCAENTMSDCEGNDLYVSSDPLQYEPNVCPDGNNIHMMLDFVDGGVHICSPCTSFYCVRGDININEIAYETADAVLFARYFVYGLSVFNIDRDNQICATDVNADGRTLMLADLIYLIRVIQRDAVPFSKLGPSADVANLIVSDGRVSVECASEIGGLLFEFDAAVTPSLLADMELLANEGKVLVWSSEGKSIEAGISDVMTFAGAELVSVTAVDREGRDLQTTVTVKVAPSAFALHPAYPNPFNPYTNMSFSLPNAAAYRLNVYNVAGQLVRSYEGMGVAGLNVITWDGMDNAGSEVSSGVYFFTVMAGPHKATAKMVLMK